MIKHQKFVAIDFESAGSAPGKTDAPVQIATSAWSIAQGHHSQFMSYLHCDQAIHWSAQKVHGITTERLKGAPTLLSLWPQLKSQFHGAIVVAHAAGTEKKFLRAFPGHPFNTWIDTLQLARAAWPTLPEHSLGFLCDHFLLTARVQSLVDAKTWHDALFDATASVVLLEHFITSHKLEEYATQVLFKPDTSAWKKHTRKC